MTNTKSEEVDTFDVSSWSLDAKVEAHKITGNMLVTFIAEDGQRQRGTNTHLPYSTENPKQNKTSTRL